MGKTEPIKLSKVKDSLKSRTIGHPLLCFRRLTSTNYMAKELALGGAREGTVIAAETQTRGKGRLAREWISPEGGLWLSLILRPRVKLKHTPKLTLMTSVAVAKTISKLFPLKTEIKWPNDVLIDRKKVCGILTETKTKGEALEFVIVGIGINANFDVSALPNHLWSSSTTLKEELRKEIERESLLRTLLEETELYYEMSQRGEFDAILSEWRSMASFLGSHVEVVSGKEKIEGWATDIDSDGALLMKLRDGTMRRVLSGDVTISQERMKQTETS